MPYIIAALALIILGTGYTLFQKTDSPLPEATDTPSKVTITETGSSTEPLVVTTTPDNNKATEPKKTESDDSPTPPDINKPTNTPKPIPTPASPTPAPADSNTYTNGTYSTTKSYRTPDGTYQMNVSVTVNNDKVTGSSLSFDSKGADSGYSKRFNSGYQSQVIGIDLGNVNLSRVGGASLTTNAFNSALDSIRSQAS